MNPVSGHVDRELASVNVDVCSKIVDVLKLNDVPVDREDSSLPQLPEELIPNFYFLLVAICHQTSPHNEPRLEGTIDGKFLVGWDFLLASLEEKANAEHEFLEPRKWLSLTAHELNSIISCQSSSPYLKGLDRRAELIRDLGVKLLDCSVNRVQQLYEDSDNLAVTGRMNLIDQLKRFEAYRDPVAKKSIFFLSIMRNCGLWDYRDAEHLAAPVDYHEVRGHLRIGSISIGSKSILNRIQAKQPVTEEVDISIRFATRDAIQLVADSLNISPSRAHYLFWNLFRSICTRKRPSCYSVDECNAPPKRYSYLLSLATRSLACPFSDFCKAAGVDEPIIEHLCDTDFY